MPDSNDDLLRNNNGLIKTNEDIIKYIITLKKKRNEVDYLIEKQQEEREKFLSDIKQLCYKWAVVNKSLKQRLIVRQNYNNAIAEAEAKYNSLLETSNKLLSNIANSAEWLEVPIEKKKTLPSFKNYSYN